MSLLVKDLNYSYKKNKQILNDVDFSVEYGKTIAVLGKNGVGKTTLMKCILGFNKIEQGHIFIDDKDINSISIKERSKLISYVSQDIYFSDETVFDAIMIGRRPFVKYSYQKKDYDIVYQLIKELDLESYMFESVSNLSGGERQKVKIASALATNAKILYLDEVTSNLDLKNQIEIIKLVTKLAHEKNMLVILNIHDLNLAYNYLDEFILLKDGSIFKKDCMKNLNEEDVFECFQVDSKIIEVDNKKIIMME